MSEQLLQEYVLRAGSRLDRALLVKFMQQTYQELFPEQQDLSHLARTVEQYFSKETPLWWVEQKDEVVFQQNYESIHPSSYPSKKAKPYTLHPYKVACLWAGNAIDQVRGDRHTHIFLLYVMPEHRRRGIGAALMHHVENWAIQRGDRQIGLQVFLANKKALNLYNKLGYQTTSLWMVKPLRRE